METVGWITRKNQRGIVEWIPPPNLDTGEIRTNDYHHPGRMLTNPEDDPDHGDAA